MTIVLFSSWNFHLSFMFLVNRVVFIEFYLYSAGSIDWSMVKPVMQVKLDPTGGQQVELLGRNKFISGHQSGGKKKKKKITEAYSFSTCSFILAAHFDVNSAFVRLSMFFFPLTYLIQSWDRCLSILGDPGANALDFSSPTFFCPFRLSLAPLSAPGSPRMVFA